MTNDATTTSAAASRDGAPRAGANAAGTLLLARHGQTVWHRENRYAGADSDIDLTPAGRWQAQRLAGWVRTRGVDAVISSPLRRALETAEPSALAAGVEVEVLDTLREVRFGIAEGATLAELDPAVVARFRADPVTHQFPGAEPPDAAAQRCAAALRAIAERFPAQTVLVVAHNTVLRLGLCVLLGLPVSRYRHVFPRLANAAVTELAVPTDRTWPAALLSLNVPTTSGPTTSGPTTSGAAASGPLTSGSTADRRDGRAPLTDVPVGHRPSTTTQELS